MPTRKNATLESADKPSPDSLYATANLLALATIGYNIIEGVVSVWLGATDGTLSLLGFGIDSFVEVISGVGIWHMVRRIRNSEGEARDDFEKRALRITGGAFYLLNGGLVVSAFWNLWQGHRPETTLWGVVISFVSISFMWLLIRSKTRIGTALNSQAILADAACSRACLYLSLALLIASLGYELTGIAGIDAIGALAIALLAWKEGREALEKAKGLSCSCTGVCSGNRT
jgi:divalent metal cation (Fe/Co/Zn/Cd) transporter